MAISGILTRPPSGIPKFNYGSRHARGAVLVSPFLNGLPAINIVSTNVWAWSGTAPSYSFNISEEGKYIPAYTLNGNGSQYVSTGKTFGLTNPSEITIEWWMNESSQYRSGDGARSIASNRTSGNAGWTVGRNSAVAGAPGNSTSLIYTIQGVASYASTYAVPARKWVHCCCTLRGTTLRQYVNGELDSTHTTGSHTTGQNIQLLCVSPAPTTTTQRWINDVHSLVIRNVALSAEEVAMRADPVQTWDLYAPPSRVYMLPLSTAAPVASNFRGLSLLGVGT